MKAFTQAVLISVFCALAASCATTPPEVIEVLNRAQCQQAATGLAQISIEDVARLRGAMLIDGPTGDENDVHSVLLSVSRGPQPTPGYGFRLQSFDLSASTLEIQLSWSEPPAGTVQAQMITHPCIVLGVIAPELQTVRVVDQNGEIGALTLER